MNELNKQLEIKKEILFQLNRMKLNPINIDTLQNRFEFIADYNSGSIPYMRKHWKMEFEIDFNGWVIGVGEIENTYLKISMTNK